MELEYIGVDFLTTRFVIAVYNINIPIIVTSSSTAGPSSDSGVSSLLSSTPHSIKVLSKSTLRLSAV